MDEVGVIPLDIITALNFAMDSMEKLSSASITAGFSRFALE